MESRRSIKQVWCQNFERELIQLDLCLRRCPFISIDTEFPGFLRNTPRLASQSQVYENLKHNIDHTVLIQLGVTLSDGEGNIGGTWEFNFCDFDEDKDASVESSIKLLKSNGLSFENIKRDGIRIGVFGVKFAEILSLHRGVRWVTFHGFYDLAYVLKLVTRKVMPDSLAGFVKVAAHVFGHVYDVKYMARYYPGLLGGELGLAKLAKILNVDRIGENHQAGSDSLLTACVFTKMKKDFGIVDGRHEGILYGVGAKIFRPRPRMILVAPSPHYCLLPRPYYPVVMPMYAAPSYYSLR